MLVVPSAKSQLQVVGFPVEVSVNSTDCPAVGAVGLKVKEAVTELGVATAMVRLVES